ncbi:MAG TPA: radical SAM family heme chaperone HemW [bacterium]|nr:radical SAM family heme chaperone HemW [bacterium]
MNAYLHIPFCNSICSYCDFTSFAGQESKMSSYVEALCREIQGSHLEGLLQTVYFGGGTPSLLPAESLEKILEALQSKAGFESNVEISLEANPETVDSEKLARFRGLGVNRLSFGAQAVQKQILGKLGRGHDWQKVESSFRAARQAGFDNLNLDLMFGLPGQDLEMFRESVRKAVNLYPDHLSLYALQVEEGTPLARRVAEGLTVPGEDMVADEYAWAQDYLASEGFDQYEVSNFAKPGKACRHNWNIWRGQDYWGFGLSAVGTVQGVRHSHGEDLPDYIAKIQKGENVLQEEVLTPNIRSWEKIMLGLRTQEGVTRSEVEQYATQNPVRYLEKFNRFIQEGFLSLRDGRYQVTSRGYFVLNGLLEALMA